MAFKINIRTVPYKSQRYPTVGDWLTDKQGIVWINVSDMGDWKAEAAVALHELAEMFMCKAHGVTQAEVDEFDKEFERKRGEGDTSESGDDPAAPYRTEHCVATGIERILAAELGLTWSEYDALVNSL